MSFSRHSSGGSDGASPCTAVRLRLHRPLAELKVLITAGDSGPPLTSRSSAACSAQASIHASCDGPEMGLCTFAEEVASGELAIEAHWLKIDSACPQASISVQVCGTHLHSCFSASLGPPREPWCAYLHCKTGRADLQILHLGHWASQHCTWEEGHMKACRQGLHACRLLRSTLGWQGGS